MSGPNDTVWSPGNQEGEFTGGSSQGLVDATGVSLADAAGDTLVDDGTTYSPVPTTTWTTNDTG